MQGRKQPVTGVGVDGFSLQHSVRVKDGTDGPPNLVYCREKGSVRTTLCRNPLICIKRSNDIRQLN